MSYAVGHNMPGYLPDGTVSLHRTFDEAKAALIGDLKFQEQYAEDESAAEDFCAAAEDVNLWNSAQDTEVDGEVWWIQESDEEVDDED